MIENAELTEGATGAASPFERINARIQTPADRCPLRLGGDDPDLDRILLRLSLVQQKGGAYAEVGLSRFMTSRLGMEAEHGLGTVAATAG